MQLAELYRETVLKLSRAGIENARADTDQLLGFALEMTRSQLYLRGTDELSSTQLARCRDLVGRRLAREPLHYITGVREFWSLEFVVSPAVLIPRPETEFLLERILDTLGREGYSGGPIVDMCTGSGVIAVVLSGEIEGCPMVAVDRSPAALQVAAQNVSRHRKDDRVLLVCADLFSALRPRQGFEVIVANPPYVAASEFAGLQPEVREWEPTGALLAGDDGLDVIRKLVADAPGHLFPGGWLFFEIGAEQENGINELFSGPAGDAYERVEIIRDWAQRPRVLQARKKG
jgi:release factor glutamine methyltransferase